MPGLHKGKKKKGRKGLRIPLAEGSSGVQVE